MQLGFCAALLASALVLGGGQGTLGDTWCQLLALGAIGVAWWRHSHDDARWPRFAWLAAVPLALPILQLLPLPEALWNMPAARHAIAQEIALVGVETPFRGTLMPLATERALWWMLPGIAMFLGVLQMGPDARRQLVWLLLFIAFVSIVLSLAQLAGGEESLLRFYAITNFREAVGFFANRNHNASMLAVVLPLVIVATCVWYRRFEDETGKMVLGVTAGTIFIALIILGLAMTRSRAGLFLGLVAIILSVPMVIKLRDHRTGLRRVLGVAIALGLVLAMNFALLRVLQRLEVDPFEDERFRYAGIATEVANAHSPLGSGFGTFRMAFEAGEPMPKNPVYASHAHNDYLEIWLEGGFLAVLFAAVIIVALLASGAVTWRRLAQAQGIDRERTAMQAAAWIGLLLFSLHSIVDYPLRTTAVLAVAGLLSALLAPSAKADRMNFGNTSA